MYINVFWFCRYNFFTDDGCEHAKMKEFTFVAGNIRSQYTLFWKNRWIFTQNYNQDLLSPVFRRACLIDLVIGAKFLGFRGFLLFENLIFFFFNFLESLFSESHRNFLHRTSDFSVWCQLPLITRNLPEVLPIVQVYWWVYFFNGGGRGGEEL